MPFSVCYKFKLHPRIDVYEINHIRTTEMNSNEEWSSQLWMQFMQFRKKPEKSSGPQQDLNPWPCNAVSMVFAKNAWDHDPILAQTHAKKKKQKRLHLKSLAAEASKTKKHSLSSLEAILLSWQQFLTLPSLLSSPPITSATLPPLFTIKNTITANTI